MEQSIRTKKEKKKSNFHVREYIIPDNLHKLFINIQ